MMDASNESYALMDVPNGSLSDVSHGTRVRGMSASHFSPSSALASRQNLFKLIYILTGTIIFLVFLLIFGFVIYITSDSRSMQNMPRKNDVPEAKKEEETFYVRESDRETAAAYYKEEDLWSHTTVKKSRVRPGVLVFNEDFEQFDTITWSHTIGASDKRFNFYVNSRNNSFVRDGKLFIKPTYTADRYGEAFLYNGTLLFGKKPDDRCLNGQYSSNLCWKDTGHPENIIHPIMSSMISTDDSFHFKYGTIEIRAKMPGGDWLEPMITLQPKYDFYGSGLRSGQIHLIDIRGNRKLYTPPRNSSVGSDKNCPDIRIGNIYTEEPVFACQSTPPDQGFDTDFHTYQLVWTPDQLTIKVDGVELVKAPSPYKSFYDIISRGPSPRGTKAPNPWANSTNPKIAPFDQEFYIILAMGVGGTSGFFSDEFVGPYPKPWINRDPKAALSFWERRGSWEPSWIGDQSAMQIDYIKVWALNSTEHLP